MRTKRPETEDGDLKSQSSAVTQELGLVAPALMSPTTKYKVGNVLMSFGGAMSVSQIALPGSEHPGMTLLVQHVLHFVPAAALL